MSWSPCCTYWSLLNSRTNIFPSRRAIPDPSLRRFSHFWSRRLHAWRVCRKSSSSKSFSSVQADWALLNQLVLNQHEPLMMFHPVTIYEIAVQHLLMGCHGADFSLFVNRSHRRPIWDGAVVCARGCWWGGGAVVLRAVFFFCVRCVFPACSWNSSLTACITAKQDKEDSRASLKKEKKERNCFFELFLTHFHAVNICLDRCLAPQENIQLCIDVIVAEVLCGWIRDGDEWCLEMVWKGECQARALRIHYVHTSGRCVK